MRIPEVRKRFDEQVKQLIEDSKDEDKWEVTSSAIWTVGTKMLHKTAYVTWQDAQLWLEAFMSGSCEKNHLVELQKNLSSRTFASMDPSLPPLRKLFDLAKSQGQSGVNEWKSIEDAHATIVRDQVDSVLTEFETKNVKQPGFAWRQIHAMVNGQRPTLLVAGQTVKDKLEKVKQYFSSMGGDVGGEQDIVFPKVNDGSNPLFNVLASSFTRVEIVEAVQSIQNGRCPGDDGIPIEALRVDSVIDALVKIFNDVLDKGHMHSSWYSILQLPIPKKGDLSKLENWRPICLVQIVVKVFHKVLYKRLLQIEPLLRVNQAGFRQGRSCEEMHCTLADLLSTSKASKVPVLLNFIDFKKAFPSISFASIRAALVTFGVPENIIACVMCIYDEKQLKAYVKTLDGCTETFPILTGTLQGDTLAPFLFLLVLDCVLRNAFMTANEDGLGHTLEAATGTRTRVVRVRTSLTDLDFADDLVLITSGTDKLFERAQILLSRVEQEAKKVNLTINVGILAA